MVEFYCFEGEQAKIVDKIIERAKSIYGNQLDELSLRMSISAVYYHTPIRLKEWLEADNFNFSHDIVGILNHINPATGKLERNFLPRFAR